MQQARPWVGRPCHYPHVSNPEEYGSLYNKWVQLLAKILVLGGSIVLFAIGGFGKAAYSGIDDFFSFFTNWAWTVQGIFYTFIAVGLFSKPFQTAVLQLFFIPCLGLSWYVFINLEAVVWMHASIIKLIQTMDPAVLELGNQFYHVIPMLCMSAFTVVFLNDIFVAQATVVYGRSYAFRVVYASWCIFFPTLLSFLYLIFHDPINVYGIRHMSIFELSVMGMWINFAVSGMFFLWFNQQYFKHARVINVNKGSLFTTIYT